NRAATALRIGATTVHRSSSYLGAQYRRLRGKLGAPKAITATAHKLALLVYRMLRWGHEYVDKGMQYYEDRHREQQDPAAQKAGRCARFGHRLTDGLSDYGERFLRRAVPSRRSVRLCSVSFRFSPNDSGAFWSASVTTSAICLNVSQSIRPDRFFTGTAISVFRACPPAST